MDIGETITIEISDNRDGYLKGEHGGERISIAGEGSVGETRDVRVIDERGGTYIAVTEGAELRLRIDEAVDEFGGRANPSYGPVHIQGAGSPDTWWVCRVVDIQEDHVTAKTKQKIPKNSSIPDGPLPDDPTQSKNDLIGQRKP
jgi:hypothetical protein